MYARAVDGGQWWCASENVSKFIPQAALPEVCEQTDFNFYRLNALKASMDDAAKLSIAKDFTIIARQLTSNWQISRTFTGKGLSLHPLDHVRSVLTNTVFPVDSPPGPSDEHAAKMRQLSMDSGFFSRLRLSPILSDTNLYLRFMSTGFELVDGSDTQLTERSTHLKDFAPSFYDSNFTGVVFGAQDAKSRKAQLADIVGFVMLAHSLLRDPWVFQDSFGDIIRALRTAEHEVCKDIYSIPALVWHLEVCLAKFYRRVRYLRGPSEPAMLRQMLFDAVVSPFVHMDSSMLTLYLLTNPLTTPRTRATDTTPKPAGLRATTQDPSPKPIKIEKQIYICKYGLAAYLKVPYPNSTNVPKCKHEEAGEKCQVQEHPDYATMTNEDLTKLATDHKSKFTGEIWPQMYTAILTAISARA